MGDAPAISGLGGEGLVHMHGVEVIRGLGEQPNLLLGDLDGLLGDHADLEFVQDVAARGVPIDLHGSGLARVRQLGEAHQTRSSMA